MHGKQAKRPGHHAPMDRDTAKSRSRARDSRTPATLNRVILLCVCTSLCVCYRFTMLYFLMLAGLLLWYYCFMRVYFLMWSDISVLFCWYSENACFICWYSDGKQRASTGAKPRKSVILLNHHTKPKHGRAETGWPVTADHVHKSGYFLLRSRPGRSEKGLQPAENMLKIWLKVLICGRVKAENRHFVTCWKCVKCFNSGFCGRCFQKLRVDMDGLTPKTAFFDRKRPSDHLFTVRSLQPRQPASPKSYYDRNRT